MRDFFCSAAHLLSWMVVKYGKQGKKAKGNKEKEEEEHDGGKDS